MIQRERIRRYFDYELRVGRRFDRVAHRRPLSDNKPFREREVARALDHEFGRGDDVINFRSTGASQRRLPAAPKLSQLSDVNLVLRRRP